MKQNWAKKALTTGKTQMRCQRKVTSICIATETFRLVFTVLSSQCA